MTSTAVSQVTSEERRRLVSEWNDTRLDYRRDVCLHELVAAQAARTPSREALVFEDQQLTYAELEARANQLAHHLSDLGVGPESLVGLWMERSALTVIGILGILKAGGAYVPFDPAYPEDRLAFMLSDCRPAAVLTQESLCSRLPRSDASVINIDVEWGAIARHSREPLRASTRPDHLAYVLYTSGSTGVPKGVAIEHRNTVALLAWAERVFDESERSVIVLSTSFCFDLSIFELFLPLITGGKVILVQDLLSVPHVSAAAEATLLNGVPSAMAELVRQRGVPEGVRTITLCGELLKQELVRKIYAETRVERVYDLYGPSEDTTYSTFLLRTPDGPQSIGRPIANTRVYLLDDTRDLVPIGNTGELYLAGDGLARGYLNRPELTAEKFVPNPFESEPGARMYRTGDLARYLPDGNLEFLGRIDHQVKIRGYRIELGDIETHLETHSNVRDAVVLAVDDGDHKKLAAYWVARQEPFPSTETLREYLLAKLPEYMVPAYFVRLDAMPLTPNSKIDRKAFPPPTGAPSDRAVELQAARTPLESFLVDLWGEILSRGTISIDDDVLRLGIDSLQAARFVNRVQTELGEPIFVVAVFEAPTVAEFARLLERDYAEAVARRFSYEGSAGDGAPEGPEYRVDAATLARFETIVPTRPPVLTGVPRSKNRPAIFVLAPPRSGTTLLRVMLAGHPSLFAASELQLLGFDTLQERRAAYDTPKFKLWLEGTLRAVMELKRCDADGAARIMASHETDGQSTQGFYGTLQSWLGDRILVDKTPAYALDPNAMRRAEEYFDGACYIHLVRHPHAMIRSFEKHHLAQVMYLHEHSFSPRQLAELIWLASHRNITRFLAEVPASRYQCVRFEDLVQNPEPVMRSLCKTLGLDFHSDLIDPYKNVESKMVDGVHPESAPMDDSKFLRHKRIDVSVAEIPDMAPEDDFLSAMTRSLARELGYRAANDSRTALSVPRRPDARGNER